MIYGQYSSPPAGYSKIDVDLNKGAKGEYIYLCFKKGDNEKEAITGMNVVADGSKDFSIQSSYTKVNQDLNKGAGGKYIYLVYTKNPDLPPIQDVTVINGSDESIFPPSDWVRISQDCNAKAGGKYIYICYYQPRC